MCVVKNGIAKEYIIYLLMKVYVLSMQSTRPFASATSPRVIWGLVVNGLTA